MKTVKYLAAFNRYFPAVSGAEVYFSQILTSLKKSGADVNVLTYNAVSVKDYRGGSAPLPKHSSEKGIDIDRYKLTKIFLKERIFHFFESISFFPYIFGYSSTLSLKMIFSMMTRIHSSDFVITGAMPFTAVIYPALRFAKLFKKKSVLIPLIHLGPQKSERFKYEYFSKSCEKLYNMADIIVVLSSYEEEYLKSINYGGHIVKIEPYIKGKNLSEKMMGDKIRLLTMGYHNFEKGFETTLEAYKLLKRRKRKVHLTVIGYVDSKYSDLVTADESITHYEFVDEDLKRKIMSESDIFILPSIAESFGIASVEANSCGLPVIGAYCSGSSSVIKNGVNGFLISFGDYQSGVLFIEQLADNKSLYKTMSRASLKIAEKFSPEMFEEKMKKLKESLQ